MNFELHSRVEHSLSAAPALASYGKIILLIGLMAFGSFQGAMADLTPQPRSPAAPIGNEIPEMYVEYPPFIVSDLPDKLPWKYARVSGFEVLSMCDAELTKDFLDSQLKGCLFLPEIFQGKRSRDVVIILFNQKPADHLVAPEHGSFETADSRWGKNQWKEFRGRIILSDRSNLVIAANLYHVNEWVSVDTELASRMLWELTPSPPAWLIEGLFGASGSLAIGGYKDRDGIRLPKLVWGGSKENGILLTQPRNTSSLLSFKELFVDSPPDRQLQPERYALWSSQVSLFSRWALYGPSPSPEVAGKFWHFAFLASRGVVNENIFRTCFEESFQAACIKMLEYLRAITAEPTDIRIPNLDRPLEETRNLKLRAATDLEIARIKGNWERMEAKELRAKFPDLAERYDAAASRSFMRSSTQSGQDMAYLDARGLYEYGVGDEKEARVHLEMVAAAHEASSLSLLAVAKLRLAECRSQLNPDAKLPAAATDALLALLFEARAKKPAIKEIYETIAEVLGEGEIRPSRESLNFMKEGTDLFPTDSSLLLLTAALFQQLGYREEAIALAQKALKQPTTR